MRLLAHVASAFVLALAACCDGHPAAMLGAASQQAAADLSAHNGVVLLLNATCSLSGETVVELNRLDDLPGVRVLVVGVPDQPGDSGWKSTFLASGLRVALAPPRKYWMDFLSRQGTPPPMLLVLRGGRVVATFSADARGMAPALSSLFSGP